MYSKVSNHHKVTFKQENFFSTSNKGKVDACENNSATKRWLKIFLCSPYNCFCSLGFDVVLTLFEEEITAAALRLLSISFGCNRLCPVYSSGSSSPSATDSRGVLVTPPRLVYDGNPAQMHHIPSRNRDLTGWSLEPR